MSLRRDTIFYNVSVYAISNIFLNLLGFLYRIFLSRATGAVGMGVYQLVMPYYSVLLALCVTGLTMATSRLSAHYVALSKQDSARNIVLSALVIFFTLFAFVASVVVCNSRFIANDILGDLRTQLSLLIILPCLFCTGIENILKNYFFGVQTLKPPIVSELSEQIIRFCAVIALLLAVKPQNAAHSSALIICGMVISEIASVIILSSFYKGKKAKKTLHIREILVIAAPVSLAALFNNLLDAATSVLIPKRLVHSGLSEVSAISEFGVLFGMTLPTLSLPFGLIAALSTVIIPKMSERLAQENFTDMRRKAAKVIHTTSLIAFPSIGFFIPLGSELCRVLYANNSAGNYMLPLCIATFFSFYRLSLGSLLNAIGLNTRVAAISVLGGLILLAGTYLVGFPSLGIKAFLAAEIISNVISAFLCFVPLRRFLKLRISLRNWFITPLLSAMLSSLCARFVFHTIKNSGMTSTVSLLCAAIAAVFIYFFALRVQGTSFFNYLKKLRS